ncbi:hypothetical protein GJ496_000115 [Pomphorhynchus laevis]|nr:hypothetical protein GJ496_000115 [Pomphorhynchus laevis]
MDVIKLANSISSDLRQLLSLVKKSSHSSVKEGTENAIHFLHEFSQDSRNEHSDLVKLCPQIVNNFITACDGKPNLKILQLSLAAIHRLVQYSLVDEKSIDAINNFLCNCSNNRIEELRIIQTTLLLISNNDAFTGPNLAKALANVIKLCSSKNIITSNTAGAAVKQIVITLFERVNKETGDVVANISNVENVLQDLFLFLNGSSPKWLDDAMLQPNSVLDLVETVARRFYSIIISNQSVLEIFQKDICRYIVNTLSKDSKNESADNPIEFQCFTKMMRIFLIILRRFIPHLALECEHLVCSTVQYLYPGQLHWKQTLAVEVLKTIFEDIILFGNLFDNVSNETIKDTIIAVSTYLRSQFSLTGSILSENDDLENVTIIYRERKFTLQLLRNDNSKNVLLDCWDNDMPEILPNYLISSTCSASLACANSIVILLREIDDERKNVITECTWCGILSTLYFLAEQCIDQILCITILDTLRNLTSSWNATSLAYHEYLKAQCRLVIPPVYSLHCLSNHYGISKRSEVKITVENEKSYYRKVAALSGQSPVIPTTTIPVLISFREILSCQSLVTFISDNFHTFDLEMWTDIMCTLQTFCWTIGYVQSLKGGLEFSPLPSGSVTFLSDFTVDHIDQLIKGIQCLFKQNCELISKADLALIESLTALGQENLDESVFVKNDRVCLFAAACLIEVSNAHLNSVANWWTNVMTHLHKGCSSENEYVQNYYVVAICTISHFALKHFGFDNCAVVGRVLDEIQQLFDDNRSHVIRRRQIDSINRILRDLGHNLDVVSWIKVFKIMECLSLDILSAEITANAFSCIDLMCAELLPDVPMACMVNLLQIIANFTKTDLNIALSATVLLWRTIDFILANHTLDCDQYYLQACEILCLLCLDDRQEVRKSAVQSLVLLINNCSSKFTTKDSWQTLINNCLLKSLSNLEVSEANENFSKSETYQALLSGTSDFICKLRHDHFSCESLTDSLIRESWMCLVEEHIKAAASSRCKQTQACCLNVLDIITSNPSTVRTHYLSNNQNEWLAVWKLWLFIGNNIKHWTVKQSSLIQFVDLFEAIICLDSSNFNCNDFENFASVIEAVVVIQPEIHILKTDNEKLHSSCFKAFKLIEKVTFDF